MVGRLLTTMGSTTLRKKHNGLHSRRETTGKLKAIESGPADALADLIASRRLQWAALHTPSSVSSLALTVNVLASAAGAAAAGAASTSRPPGGPKTSRTGLP